MVHPGFHPLSNTTHVFEAIKNLGRDALSVLYVEALHSRATGLCPCPSNPPHLIAACPLLSPFLRFAKSLDSLMDTGMSISTIHDKICKACYQPFLFPSQVSPESSFKPGHCIDATRTPCRTQTNSRLLPIISFVKHSDFKTAIGFDISGPVTPESLAQWLLTPVGPSPDGRIRLHVVELTTYFLRRDVLHTPHHNPSIAQNLRQAATILVTDPPASYIKRAIEFRKNMVSAPPDVKPSTTPVRNRTAPVNSQPSRPSKPSQRFTHTPIIDLTPTSPIPSTSSAPEPPNKTWVPPYRPGRSQSSRTERDDVVPNTLQTSPGPTRTPRAPAAKPKPYSDRGTSSTTPIGPSPSQTVKRMTTILEFREWKKTTIMEY